MYYLFIEVAYGISGFTIAIFYASLHFSMVELKHEARMRHILSILVVAATLFSFTIGGTNFYHVISIYLFHVGIFFLIRYILDALQNRVRLSSWEIVHIGGYIFTVFLTLSYGTLILATNQEFPFTCEAIYENSENIVDTVTYPLSLGKETISDIKERSSTLPRISVGDALGLPEGVEKQELLSTGESLGTGQGGLIGAVDTVKTRLVDQVLEDNAAVNMGICEFLVGEIESKYNDPVFQFSIILLLFILFYPFLRMIVFIIEAVSRVVLKLLLVIGVYNVEKVIEESEDVM